MNGQQLALQTQEKLMSTVENLQIQNTPEMWHSLRLAKLFGVTALPSLQSPVNSLLIQLGGEIKNWQERYEIFVGARFISAFPYAAGILPANPANPTNEEGNGKKVALWRADLWRTFDFASVHYRGDIPEFALDAIDRAVQWGIDTVTIHSIQPLPVFISPRRRLHFLDPVVVGWLPGVFLPRIHVGGWFRGLRFRECNPAALGVVLAAWDLEGERIALEHATGISARD